MNYASLFIILIKDELIILVYTKSDETNYCAENLTNSVSVIMNKALVRWGLLIVRSHISA